MTDPARGAHVLSGVRARLAVALAAARAWSEPYRGAAQPWLGGARRVLNMISGLGWLLIAAAVLGAAAGARLGWREASYGGALLGLLFLGSCLSALGRAHLQVVLDVEPPRLRQGELAAVRLAVTNVGRSPLLPLAVEVPIGLQEASLVTSPLAPLAHWESAEIIVPTSRRGVIPIGPVVTQRGDPFGVVRREITWTEQVEVFVHPLTVALDPLGAGLLRDLEGRTTQDISMSDLAFHTLRGYVPGDDRRHIHWRSSAKIAGLAGEERFLVRQFLDTRRSHVGIVVDVSAASYRGEEEFELALQVAASVAVRALTDRLDLTIVCGDHAGVQPAPPLALDVFSRAEIGESTLATGTGRLVRLAPDASVVVLVTGSQCAFSEVLQARNHLGQEVAVTAIRLDPEGRVGLRETAGVSVVTLSALAELPRVLARGQLV